MSKQLRRVQDARTVDEAFSAVRDQDLDDATVAALDGFVWYEEAHRLRLELKHHGIHVHGYPFHWCRSDRADAESFVCVFCGRTCL